MKVVYLGIACFFLLSSPSAVFGEVSNPGFETGDTSGWNTQTNGNAIAITVVSGETTTSAGTINPSLTNDFYAFTSQSGPGSSFLWQTFTVQEGTNRIFFDIAINNAAPDFFVPDPLSLSFVGEPNQQARFDILVPGANVDTVDPNDIIVTGFQTQPGDPLIQDWVRYDIDVTGALAPFVGETVTLRFVQVDNQFFFNMAIDNLSVGSEPPPGVGPEPEPMTSCAINGSQDASVDIPYQESVTIEFDFVPADSQGCYFVGINQGNLNWVPDACGDPLDFLGGNGVVAEPANGGLLVTFPWGVLGTGPDDQTRHVVTAYDGGPLPPPVPDAAEVLCGLTLTNLPEPTDPTPPPPPVDPEDPPTAIPTLSHLGLILLAGLFAILAWSGMRRRGF